MNFKSLYPNRMVCPCIDINEPFLFEGGADGKSQIRDCKHAADEDCTAACTYYKFVASGYNKGKSSSKQDRIGFIKKVYGILGSMLFVTAVIICATLNNSALKGCEYGGPKWENICRDEKPDGLIPKIWMPCAIGAVVTLLVLVCGTSGGKYDEDTGQPIAGELPQPLHMVVPYNYTLLSIFTILSSVVVSKISLASQQGAPGVVFEASALTAAAVIGITIFAFTGLKDQDNGIYELSFIAPGLSALALVFGVAAFFVFGPQENLGCDLDETTGKCKRDGMKLLYACIGVVLFALIMLFDTKSVIGGKSMMFELGPETYILGALQLYLEIINMFVLLMVILGEAN